MVILIAIIIKPTLNYLKDNRLLSSVFFQNSIDPEDLLKKYKNDEDIKIIIVPGHDENNSGAVFGAVKEADMNLKVAEELFDLFKNDKHFETLLVRDADGYNEKISAYIEENSEEIQAFVSEKKDIMQDLNAVGKVNGYVNVQHNSARPEVVKILYGINKYANDNDFDIILHVHFNDYPGRSGSDGKYSGFSVNFQND